MKTLIINNHTKHIDELASLIPDSVIVQKEDLKESIDMSPYGLLIISGGSGVPGILEYPDAYMIESKLAKEAKIPVLGICLGSEILVHAFGGTLKKLEEKHRGVIKLEVSDTSLFASLDKEYIEVYESHSVAVKDLPNDFIACASSDHGIEILKHISKPIIGIQFHPEVVKNEGLFKWIFDTLGVPLRVI